MGHNRNNQKAFEEREKRAKDRKHKAGPNMTIESIASLRNTGTIILLIATID